MDLELHQKYGTVVRIAPNEIIFSNPDHFKAVYGAGTSKPFKKGRFYEAPAEEQQAPGWDKLDMLVEEDVDKLRIQKRMIGPIYSIANGKKHENLIDKSTERWLKRLNGMTGQPVNFYYELELLNVDTMCELTLGEPFGAVEAGSDGNHMASMDKMWSHWAWIGHLPWLNRLDRKYGFLYRNKFTLHTIEMPIFPFLFGKFAEYQKREDEKQEHTPCILDDVRTLEKNREEFRHNWGTMICMTDLGAGVDTSSWTMAAFIAGVCMNPKVYSRVQSEIDESLKAGRITKGQPVPYDEAAKMEYFQNSIHESMRLWPNIAMGLQRIVPPDGLGMDGFFLPGGTVLGMSAKILGQSEDIFGPDPEVFRPERWEVSKEKRADMDSRNLGFGGPSRKCPGKNIAWVNMSKNLAFLLTNFDVKVLNRLGGEPGPGGGKWIERGSFVTKWDGMEVELKAR